MLRWPIRVASVIALTVLAYGWGDWWRERPLLDGILLALLSLVLLIAVSRLYRPGGLAAFEDTSGRAPGETVAAPIDSAPRESRRERLERREREKRERRAAEQRERRASRSPEPTTPAATRDVQPPRARGRESGGSLWSESARRTAPGPIPGPGGSRAAAGSIDLNSATADELAMLPGIGRAAAGRVVAHRDERGPFASIEQLAEVEGFDAARVARVAGRIRV